MSMISPTYFVEQYKDYKYEDLLPIRDELIEDIKAFEQGGESEESIIISPSPSVIYQSNLEYLSELLKLIAEKYREGIVWKDDEE